MMDLFERKSETVDLHVGIVLTEFSDCASAGSCDILRDMAASAIVNVSR